MEQKQEIELVTDFVRGCGLRRSELKWLCVGNFYQRHPIRFSEQHWIHVDALYGVPAHEVPFLDEYAWTIAEVCKEKDPRDQVLPDLDYEALRRDYAYSLFMRHYDALGATEGPRSLHEVGQLVKHSLGLTRLDATLQKWLHWTKRDLGVY